MPRYKCRCGFPCFSTEQEDYHRSGTCLALRRLLGVMAARQRLGRHEHDGLAVGGFVLRRAPSYRENAA